jgi:hypothetical protein
MRSENNVYEAEKNTEGEDAKFKWDQGRDSQTDEV